MILEPFAETYDLAPTLDVVAIGNPDTHVISQITDGLTRAGRTWRAILMTRDPRDSVVSALHYHKWSVMHHGMSCAIALFVTGPTSSGCRSPAPIGQRGRAFPLAASSPCR